MQDSFLTRHSEIMELIAEVYSTVPPSRGTSETAPYQSPPITIPVLKERILRNDTVLFRQQEGKKLFQVLDDRLTKHNLTIGLLWKMSRLGWSGDEFTYGHYQAYNQKLRNGNTSITLRDLIKAEITLTNVKASGIVRTFTELETELSFEPRNLRHYAFCNLSMLYQLFNVTWKTLLRNYMIGPHAYFIDLKLPIQDISNFGLTPELFIHWGETLARFGKEENLAIPPLHQTPRLHRALDRKMILSRRDITAQDWNTFFGLTIEHLRLIGFSYRDAQHLWNISSRAQFGNIFGSESSTDESFEW